MDAGRKRLRLWLFEQRRSDQAVSLFILFNTITVRDGIEVAKAHDAFLAIDEYRPRPRLPDFGSL
jgi:hypothetical protein